MDGTGTLFYVLIDCFLRMRVLYSNKKALDFRNVAASNTNWVVNNSRPTRYAGNKRELGPLRQVTGLSFMSYPISNITIL